MDELFADAGSVCGYLGFMNVMALELFEALGLLRLRKGLNFILEISDEQICFHEETFQEDQMRDFTDCFIAEWLLKEDDKENKKFARQNLRNIYADLFLAGSETMSSGLKWAMLFMVNNPDIQERVQVEKALMQLLSVFVMITLSFYSF